MTSVKDCNTFLLHSATCDKHYNNDIASVASAILHITTQCPLCAFICIIIFPLPACEDLKDIVAPAFVTFLLVLRMYRRQALSWLPHRKESADIFMLYYNLASSLLTMASNFLSPNLLCWHYGLLATLSTHGSHSVIKSVYSNIQ